MLVACSTEPAAWQFAVRDFAHCAVAAADRRFDGRAELTERAMPFDHLERIVAEAAAARFFHQDASAAVIFRFRSNRWMGPRARRGTCNDP